MVELLLQYGACSVETRDAPGNTPLNLAARNGWAAVVERLLSVADARTRIEAGISPLLNAVMFGSSDICEALLRNLAPDAVNATVSLRTGYEETLLQLFAITSHVSTNGDVKEMYRRCLQYEGDFSSLPAARDLLAWSELNINQKIEYSGSDAGSFITPLEHALRRRHVDYAKHYLDLGADADLVDFNVSEDELTLLGQAIVGQYYELAILLLQHDDRLRASPGSEWVQRLLDSCCKILIAYEMARQKPAPPRDERRKHGWGIALREKSWDDHDKKWLLRQKHNMSTWKASIGGKCTILVSRMHM